MSERFEIADALEWCRGTLVRGARAGSFSGVSIDSRTVSAGDLFVAVRGENLDGHRFVAGAVTAGAAGVLIDDDAALDAIPEATAAIRVADTTKALGDLAHGHRLRFTGPLIAITGSNGKTTTKEMCAAILSVRGPCLKTRGNLNNQFGLPLTLLSREPEHVHAVVEIGMNHRGEIAPLAAIASPSVGVITNVGTAHIEFLGSQDEIALEKGDLVASLPETAVAVLNADDARVLAQGERCRARVISFGLSAGASVRGERITALGDQGFAFDVATESERLAVHVRGLGETTVINALAAAAAALGAGFTLGEVADGLSRYEPVGGRMEKVSLPRNIIVINDTYNANPQSTAVALRSLARLKGTSRGFAVLGDMGELGDTARKAHRDNGRLVAELGLDYLFALGKWAEETASGAEEAGMAPGRVIVARDHDEIFQAISGVIQGDDWVLVKGSRAMQMERVVDRLAGEVA
jgi:UDP-N-acetylmuramoyl-tripeptide--D-alanyl-D-alanine ligase